MTDQVTKTFIFEHPTGCILHVEYSKCQDTVPHECAGITIDDVRVASAVDYKPCGPNLAGLLHAMFTTVEVEGGLTMVVPFMNVLAYEINHVRH